LISCGRRGSIGTDQLALADHVHRFDPSDDNMGTVEPFESEHGPNDAFVRPVILLDDVVEILALAQLDIGAMISIVTSNGGDVGAALVDGDFVRFAVQ